MITKTRGTAAVLPNPCEEILLEPFQYRSGVFKAKYRSGVFKALDHAYTAWRKTPNDGEKYIDFNVMAEEKFGVRVTYDDDFFFHRRKAISTEILDEHKYAMFLLRWL